MYELTVIIPTYKEQDNIRNTILKVFDILNKAHINGEILVVDDNSPDGTIAIVRNLQQVIKNLNLTIRLEDKGLSQSVVCGFENSKSSVYLVIDADGSHDLSLIPAMYKEILKGNDIVIGSRYMEGGGIKEWPINRRLISIGATFLGRLLLPDITDPVSGFFAFKKGVIENAQLKPKGYKILLEVLGKGKWNRFKEIPYEFVDRQKGSSKLKFGTIFEYAQQVMGITLYSFAHHESAAWREWSRIFKFGMVGISGIVVNMALLYYLKEFAGLPLMLASFIAIEMSIINNFYWNDKWTFNQKRDTGILSRCYKFHLISFAGLVINMGLLYGLTSMGMYYLVANIIGILAGFVWNFVANRRLTWRKND